MNKEYKKSGVDIEAGEAFIEKIKSIAGSTANKGSSAKLGGYGGLFDLKPFKFKDPILVATTDGVGTKIKLASQLNCWKEIGCDLGAMCFNDLFSQGATPMFFLDYLATSSLSLNNMEKMVEGIAESCKLAGAALIGGETAEMPGMYSKGEMDAAGFAVGAAERGEILPRSSLIKDGDLLIALPSSGLHANGFSLARKIFEEKKIKFEEATPWAKNISWKEEVVRPTKIYAELIPFFPEIKGISHITGGGFLANVPRIIPNDLVAEINLQAINTNEIFKWISKEGHISGLEMVSVFNCGAGMILVVEEKKADYVSSSLNGFIVGHLVKKKHEDSLAVKVNGIEDTFPINP